VFVNNTEEHSVSVAEAAKPKPRLGLAPVIAKIFGYGQQDAAFDLVVAEIKRSRREMS
jgi:hypothetical protein